MARIGLLAGSGKLPEIWLEEALQAGEEVVAYHINPQINDSGKSSESGESGETGELGESEELGESREFRESGESAESRENRESREVWESRESGEQRGKSGGFDSSDSSYRSDRFEENENKDDNRPDLSQALRVREIGAGRLGELIEGLKDDNIKKIIMLGKIEKSRVFQPAELDREMQQLLAGLDDLQDETILKAIARRLGQEGFELLPQNSYLDNIFLDEGWLVEPFSSGTVKLEDLSGEFYKSTPEAAYDEASRIVSERAAKSSGSDGSERLKQQLEWGLELAKKLSGLEIGQTIMFKSGTVLAVEAVEGTDAAICRAGELAGTDGSGFFMAKASRPGQDFRLDIPAVGPETLKGLKEAGGRALVVEAGRVLVLEQEKMAELAAEWGIAIYAGSME